MLKDFWALPRIEQRAFVVIASLLVLVVIANLLPIDRVDEELVEMLEKAKLNHFEDDINSNHIQNLEVTIFNPNQVSIKQLEKLGLKSYAILNWKKFIESGGFFYTPEDVLKIYGVDSLFYERIKTYIVIDESIHDIVESKVGNPKFNRIKNYHYRIDLNRVNKDELLRIGIEESVVDSILTIRSQYWFNHTFNPDSIDVNKGTSVFTFFKDDLTLRQDKKNNEHFIIELNSADTSQLVLLKGIGTVLAKRIVSYRKLLGGYCKIEQLLQVYGISPELVESLKSYLIINTSLIIPCNLNQKSLRQLKDHPLLGYYKAQAIVDYRKEHGEIDNIDQILELKLFADVDASMFKNYFCVK